MEYRPEEFEKKWQKIWEEKKLFKTNIDSKKKKYYALVMFPYPSGTLHVGHAKNYVIGDVVARFRRQQGYEVLHPIGFDSFGLPAENAAIEKGGHPETFTFKNIETITKQMKNMGISYDWDRMIYTCTEDYYKWTQWLFIELYKKGLAYKKEGSVNWCPHCNTVLANEQVVDGKCERCGTVVEKKFLSQWYFKITEYAEKLLNDIDKLDGWPDRVKTMQRNWIGKSTGAEVDFKVVDMNKTLTVFTTRPDTLWGVTFMAISPESPVLQEIVHENYRDKVNKFLNKMAMEDRFERTSVDSEKEGVFIGRYAINPVNGEKIPIYVANYILNEYGTGVIMAVPAHDERDYQFAKKYNIPIIQVIEPENGENVELPYTEKGILINSGEFSGLNLKADYSKIFDFLEEKGIGKRSTQYKLRDWVISRQRYWGAPIPMVYCEKCGHVPVNSDDLPVKLPKEVEFKPSGVSPLKEDSDFIHTKCPICGGDAIRETDTMDTFVDSSWYYLRYINPKLEEAAFDKEKVNRWLPVDQYIGGVEHAVLHLLYSRFITKALHDMGYLDFDEPFKNLFTQGMIYKDGFKMSKSKGNIVSPDAMIEKYGIDTLRVYILFIGPPEKDVEWSDRGIEGANRFVKRIWNLYDKLIPMTKDINSENLKLKNIKDENLRRKLHSVLKSITEDMEGKFHFNTAISKSMELINEVYDYLNNNENPNLELLKEFEEKFLVFMYPITPHLSEELWHRLGKNDLVAEQEWPKYDKNALIEKQIELAVQINGKVKGRISINADITKEDLEKLVLDKFSKKINGEVKKFIYVPKKLVSLVVK